MFWGLEVKPCETVHVYPGVAKILRIKMAALFVNESSRDEQILVHITVGDRKFTLASLYPLRLPQTNLSFMCDSPFDLSHTWKGGSVFFTGYKVDADPFDVKLGGLFISLPSAGHLTMVRFIDGGGSFVELLEYKRTVGRIIDNLPFERGMVVPAAVVDVAGGDVTLTSALSAQQMEDCEVDYLKRKHVRSLLVAFSNFWLIELEAAYQCSWIGYDQLYIDDDESFFLRADVAVGFKAVMRWLMRRVIYYSLRLVEPSILHKSEVFGAGFCWAVALIRQGESVLKRAGIHDVELSIQDLVDKMQEEDFFEEGEADIIGLELCRDVFMEMGIAEARDVVFTGLLNKGMYKRGTHPLHYFRVFEIEYEQKYEFDAWDSLLEDNLMRFGPLTVSMAWFRSFGNFVNANEVEDVVFRPTDHELDAYRKLRLGSTKRVFHSYLLTGHGVNENGEAFWELQDCSSFIGDRGFFRISREVNVIDEFVTLKREPHTESESESESEFESD